jgi:hypothetical protein
MCLPLFTHIEKGTSLIMGWAANSWLPDLPCKLNILMIGDASDVKNYRGHQQILVGGLEHCHFSIYWE